MAMDTGISPRLPILHSGDESVMTERRHSPHLHGTYSFAGEITMIAVSRQLLDLDRHPINDTGMSRVRAVELESRSDTAIRRLTIIRRAIASGASACFRRFLAALHDSRRKQAAIARARYRHLIYDPDTGTCFGVNPPARGDHTTRD
jgi:hypothetical protein